MAVTNLATRSTATGAPAPRPLLQVENQYTRFLTDRGVVTAVDGVSLHVERGESVGVVGESGSGKSVLVRSIMNILPRTALVPPESKVWFEGRDTRRLTIEEARHFWGTQMGMIFQDPMTSLNPVRRVGKQLTDPLRFHLGLSKAEARQRAAALLAKVGLSEPERRLDQYPHELSGGMRQRVMIAIALSCEPKLLIADEPTTALDVTVQRQILHLLGSLQHELGMSMMLITHDLGVVAAHTRRVVVMYAGHAVETAPTEQIFSGPRHPYTEALIRSIPRLDHPQHAELPTIGGRPPDMRNPPSGCRFAPRCTYAQERCLTEVPPDTWLASDHSFRCFYPLSTPEGEAALARNLARGSTAAGLEVGVRRGS